MDVYTLRVHALLSRFLSLVAKRLCLSLQALHCNMSGFRVRQSAFKYAKMSRPIEKSFINALTNAIIECKLASQQETIKTWFVSCGFKSWEDLETLSDPQAQSVLVAKGLDFATVLHVTCALVHAPLCVGVSSILETQPVHP